MKVSLLLLLAATTACLAKKDYSAYCGACKAVVDELYFSVAHEDQSKTLQTGSFRVDSAGRQVGLRERRYAGSETHLTELLEEVCALMQNYGTTTDTSTGARGFLRINSRAGETISISNVNLSSGGTKELTDACNYLVSEYEDDIIGLFLDELSQQEIERELCNDVTMYCGSKHTEL